jgi:AcrR family transcriptional regulator
MSKADAPSVSLRDQQRAFTRERLIQGALEVFAEKGYVAATIDDIVAAAGASRATFYLHFRSKSDICVELGARMSPGVAGMYAELDGLLEEGSREELLEWMRRAVRWMEDHSVAIGAGDAAQVVDGPLPDRSTMEIIDHMPRLRQRWPADGEHQVRVRMALLATQFRAAFTFLLASPEMRDEISDDELAEVLTDVWLTGLTPPQATGTPANGAR